MELVENIICALKYSRLNPRLAFQIKHLMTHKYENRRKRLVNTLTMVINYLN